ncbi:methyltransferase domain-containing protein [Tsuneonella sp. CC-YZS046]|uniref:methyltransferase domain-containing protein n=1 Tax=Tsuneonella sp. CC-YZS046 TaxID=3042152 RepID=UPI002D77FA2A|nr:methyltransferase domain-containing protein [Tsuneonella sp. CC-YZS046]WRO67683.1 methyltransferase domain-containing protein [Tsuneonella sp. CC-YZS046]
MSAPAPPIIFSRKRSDTARRRALALHRQSASARYIIDDMVEDVLNRLDFIRFEPKSALIVGDWTGSLAEALQTLGCAVTQADPAGLKQAIPLDQERPYPFGPFDFIASLGTLDTVNDLPGALIHIRNALTPSGMAIASFVASGSLPRLRTAMLVADGDRPAPRLHPMVDVRAGGQLLQRAGFAKQVADGRGLDVRFGSLASLIADLRAQALGNVLADPAPPLTRDMLARAEQAFLEAADPDGRVTERFEILTLSGWRA